MNMTVHGDGSSGIFLHHGLTDVPGAIECGRFDICLTNPPFGSFENDPELLKAYELGRGHSSQDRVILGIERALDLVRPGGRIGMITIDGVLNNQSMRYIREHIKRRARVLGVVSLNKETFEGYNARAKTSVIFLQKRDSEDNNIKINGELTFFAVASNTGYAPNGSLVPGNELPDILRDFKEFQKGRSPSLHPRVRVCQLNDRMDAEFYVPRSHQASVEFSQTIEMIRIDAESLLGELSSLEERTAGGMAGEMDAIPLSQALESSSSREKIDPEASYDLLGVKWWGGGTFVREMKIGKEISSKTIFKVTAGDIIYSRLFAYRGSFAVVSPEHDGMYVSNEFPTFRIKNSLGRDPDLFVRYLVEMLNSPEMLSEVDRLSTGSTKQSRNRFYEDSFFSLLVDVPKSDDLLRAAVGSFTAVSRIREVNAALSERLKVVKGQLGSAMMAKNRTGG